MRRVRKLVALLLSLAMVLAMSGMAMAAAAPTTLTDGEVGGFDPGNVDNPQVQTKSVNIKKEIKAYNPDESYVYGPAITYTYSITAAAGEELVNITDQPEDHTSGVATVTKALAGVGTPVLNGTAANVIAWTNTDILEASATGVSNYKNLNVDFSSIVFTQPGVYRYKISETVTYDNTGVTDGAISDTRYLDVYVMRSGDFDPTHDGTTGHEYVAGDWSIYGYVCISPESVTNDAGGKTAVDPNTKKTNGFIYDDTNSPDEYYTYNFVVSKDLVGDNNMINNQFPLAVAFSGGPSGTFQLIAETDADSKSTITTTTETATTTVNGNTISGSILKVGSAVALSSFGNAGSPKVADGNTTTGTTVGFIKYIGIPNTTIVSVTETNNVIGTTYTASVKEDVGSGLATTTITSTTGTMGASDATASIDNGETATRTAATGGTAGQIAKNVQIQFTNNLATISPTGLMFRYGPYVLILICGVVLLFLGVKFMRRNKEED